MEDGQTLYYLARGAIKHSEEDIFNDGCVGNGSSVFLDDEIKADSLSDLIDALMTFTGCKDKKSVLLNACGEIGRIDIQVYETKTGITANASHLAKWKKGAARVWLCDYSFKVIEVLSEPFDFDNMEDAHEYELNS